MKLRILLLSAILAMFASSVKAEELTFGSDAPKLDVKEFVKGDEVTSFEKGKVYVVELWATWCGPCLQSIPHLTALQKKHSDVTFIGVAILQEDQDEVAKFVKKMGDKMDYRVALDNVTDEKDPESGKTVENWMKAANAQGIPTAFIVNGEGKIAWIGHPMEMDEPVARIAAGDWDIAAEVKKITEAKELREKMMKVFARVRKQMEAFKGSGDPTKVFEELDAATEAFPQQTELFRKVRFDIMTHSKGLSEQAVELGQQIIESQKEDDVEILNELAWVIVNPDRSEKSEPKLVSFALKIALKADQLCKEENPVVADTLGKAYFDDGKIEKAIETQERVMKLIEGTQLAEDRKFKRRLRQYQRALEAKNKPAKSNADGG
jgi:thiol-disulfide isomerase/thioredoxin